MLRRTADELLRRATGAGDVPGVVAVATDRERTIYEGASGLRALGQAAAMAPDSVVWIASMTKALTSAAALQLVERGMLELDAALATALPVLAAVPVLEGFDASGQPSTRAPRRPVTLRHLLSHTSGFGYEYWNASVQQYRKAKGLPGIASCRNAALQLPLLFDPGERWEYGISTDWLGKVIEAASGMRLGQFLTENLLGPLGMRDTAFHISASMRGRLAKIHERGADGRLAATGIEVPQEPEFESGGGGLYGTADDYMKFVRLILNHGHAGSAQLLRPETVESMGRNQTGQFRVGTLVSVVPRLSRDLEFFPGLEKHFGLGFQVTAQRAATGMSAGSLLWAGLANCYYWIDPASGLGGATLTQVLPFADPACLALFLEFQKAVYQ